jgi:predicted unusual protein kinase regulating ubiquinone biosynthesis (AarF/ABC1/UbiB family)
MSGPTSGDWEARRSRERIPLLAAAERLRRARRVGLTFGRVYLGIKANQFIARRLRPLDMGERWSSFHRSSAESIYDAAIDLHGMILKGCQFLGARGDVLPREYVQVLSRLQDRVPARSFRAVRSVIESELRVPLESVFREFEARPVGSASLAQVHEARLHDGRRVAVKVQYPGIASQVEGDLANLRTLLQAVGLLEREVDLMPLIDELAAHVPLELDFVNEARNAEALAKSLSARADVVVPEIVWEHTTTRLLVMEFLEGIKIDDVETLRSAGVDLDAVAGSLVQVFAEQILGHGFFHADPHPGNVFVQPEGPRLVLLDFGLAKELPPRFREGVFGVASGLLAGDASLLATALIDLGFETRNEDPSSLHALATIILRITGELRGGGLDAELVAQLRAEILESVRRDPIVRVPSHLMLLGRVLGLLAGVTHSLDVEVDLFRALAPHVWPAKR